MAEVTLVASTTAAVPSGRANQNHLIYATNSARWWHFYWASTTTIASQYTTDFVTWTAGATYTVTGATAGSFDGRDLSVDYHNLGATDVVHLTFSDINAFIDHIRGTISGTTLTWGGTQSNPGASATNSTVPTGVTTVLDNGGVAWNATTNSGDFGVAKASNADTGGAWTNAFGAESVVVATNITNSTSNRALSAFGSSSKILAVCGNAAAAASDNQLFSSLWSGTAWGAETSIGSTSQSEDFDDWGLVRQDDTHFHVVRRNGASGYEHRIFNGTTWGAGASIPTQTSKAAGGLALASDGTNVWLFVIDSAAGNAVRYIKYNGAAWDAAWSTLESTSATRTAISACPQIPSSTLSVIWTEGAASPFSIAGEQLVIGGTTPVSVSDSATGSETVSVADVTPAMSASPLIVPHGQWPNAPLRQTQRMALTTKAHFPSGISENDAVAGATEQFYGEPDVPVISNAKGQWPNPLRITQRMALTWKTHAPVPGALGAGISENDLTPIAVGLFYGVVNAPATRNILDSAVGSESLSISASAPVSDSATGTETVSIGVVSISVSDSATGSETVGLATVAVAVADSAAGSEALSFATIAVAVSDSAAGSESLSFAAVALSISDSATGTDAYTATGILLSDSAAGSEVLSFATIAVAVSDSATGTDAYTSTGIPVADSAAGSEALSFATVAVPVADSATGSESFSLATVAVSISDSATGSESVSVNTGGGSTPISVSDSATGSEVVSLAVVSVSVSDSATGSESLSFAQVALSVSDGATGTEALSFATIAIPVADAAAGSEALGFGPVLVSVADAAVGSEAAPGIFATLSISDSALGSEVLLRIVQIFLNDSATGAETFALGLVAVAVADQAVGSERVQLPTIALGNAFVALVVPNGVVILRAQNGRVSLVAPTGQAKLLP